LKTQCSCANPDAALRITILKGKVMPTVQFFLSLSV
jgi:hypothetical protein